MILFGHLRASKLRNVTASEPAHPTEDPDAGVVEPAHRFSALQPSTSIFMGKLKPSTSDASHTPGTVHSKSVFGWPPGDASIPGPRPSGLILQSLPRAQQP